jgi:hypothetical protein
MGNGRNEIIHYCSLWVYSIHTSDSKEQQITHVNTLQALQSLGALQSLEPSVVFVVNTTISAVHAVQFIRSVNCTYIITCPRGNCIHIKDLNVSNISQTGVPGSLAIPYHP